MRYDVLYLSPHPDDAVFSAGGAIALDVRAGRRVGVVTVFSVTGDQTERARRAEDEAAIALLGAARIELGLTDAPVRDRRYRRPSWLLRSIGASEQPLVEEVRAALRPLTESQPRVIGPLAVGQHVDHQIVHAAAASLDCDVAFYEDVPYAMEPFAVARRLARLGTGGPARGGFYEELRALVKWWNAMPMVRNGYSLASPMAALTLAVADLRAGAPATINSHEEKSRWVEERIAVGEALDLKLAAIAAYESQWPLFYRSLDAWRSALEGNAQPMESPRHLKVPIERRWRLLRG